MFASQLNNGEDYMMAKKVISINLMEGNYNYNNFNLVNNYGFVNKYNYGVIKDECLEMYLIRIDLVKDIVYNLNETRFIKWIKLIKAGGIEEMKKIAEEDEDLKRVVKFMEEFVNDEEVRALYDKINDVERVALDKGKAEGKAEGESIGILKTAKNMLHDGLNIESIIKYTGLSEKEIEALK